MEEGVDVPHVLIAQIAGGEGRHQVSRRPYLLQNLLKSEAGPGNSWAKVSLPLLAMTS